MLMFLIPECKDDVCKNGNDTEENKPRRFISSNDEWKCLDVLRSECCFSEIGKKCSLVPEKSQKKRKKNKNTSSYEPCFFCLLPWDVERGIKTRSDENIVENIGTPKNN